MFAFQSSPFNGSANQNIREFFATGNTGFQVWQKPQGYSLAYMLCIGAGGSGGGGSVSGAGTGGGGGGGGSTDSIGTGGRGGAGGNGYVCIVCW